MLEIFGFKSPTKQYGYAMDTYDVDGVGSCRYATWLHPNEPRKGFEKEHIEEYRNIIHKGDFCIDIGARTGDTTIPIAILAGKEGAVLALEPNPFVFHVLQKNARAARSITNIIPLMAAASVSEGFIDFEYYDSGYYNGGRHENISIFRHGHAYRLKVFAVNLENELRKDYADLLPKLSFIKIDCEGSDLSILKTLRSIIKEFKPIIRCEVSKYTSKRYRIDMLTFFSDLNYSVQLIDVDSPNPEEAMTVENCQQWKKYDIHCVPNK